MNRIREQRQTRPFLGEFLPCPAGMVGPVEEGLGVGHQAEDPSRRVADPRYAVYGAVGIRGIVQRCLAAMFIAVLDGDEALPVESFQDLVVLGDEFPLSMTDGQIKAPEPPGEDAGGGGVDPEMDPAVLEPSRVIEGERDGLTVEMAVEAGEHPQFDKELETVADAEDQFSLSDEPQKLVEEPLLPPRDRGMQNPVGPRLCRSEVVAVEEAAGQVQKVIVVELLLAAEEFAQVDDLYLIEAGEPAGMGHLHFAVRSVSRDDDRFDFLRHRVLSLPPAGYPESTRGRRR